MFFYQFALGEKAAQLTSDEWPDECCWPILLSVSSTSHKRIVLSLLPENIL